MDHLAELIPDTEGELASFVQGGRVPVDKASACTSQSGRTRTDPKKKDSSI